MALPPHALWAQRRPGGGPRPTLIRTEPVKLPLSISLRTCLQRFPDQPELFHPFGYQNPHRYGSHFTRRGVKYK